MSATPVAVNTITRTGIATVAPAACDAVNGNVVNANTGLVWLEFTNSDTSSHTVTVTQPGTVDTVASPGRVLTIPASTTAANAKRHGGWPEPVYGGTIQFLANSALVSVAAYQLGT